jgi:hypothetical protein
VGLLDILRGQRAPKRADLDRLFAIQGAAMTLEAGLGITLTGRAGVCFKPIEAGLFDQVVKDAEGLLALAEKEEGTRVERHQDEMGFSWILLIDPDLEDLAVATHVVSQTLQENGCSEQLLCAQLGFRGAEGPVDLIYAYKRGTFYPFAPRPGRKRDNALELRLKAALEHELPIEEELERWYPVWDSPVDGPEAAAG